MQKILQYKNISDFNQTNSTVSSSPGGFRNATRFSISLLETKEKSKFRISETILRRYFFSDFNHN
jgi:CRISPR/Cas system CMR-associated protein Cmr1 (group 7 of RAMP superfamily)